MTAPTTFTPDHATLTSHFEFLDELRESGDTNMFGAAPYLQHEFCMDKRDARGALKAWMETFSDAPASDRALAYTQVSS